MWQKARERLEEEFGKEKLRKILKGKEKVKVFKCD